MKVFVALVSAALLCASSGAFPADGLISPHLTGSSKVSNPSDYPFAVALKLTTASDLVRLCAATRITNSWFVTAAECLERLNYKEARVLMTYVDENKQLSQLEFGMNNVRFVKIHPEYDSRRKENNIGIFAIAAPLPAVSQIAELPESDDASFADQAATVVAWKDSLAPEWTTPSMVAAETSVMSEKACKKEYYFTTLAQDSVCASGAGRKSLSRHDAGVPLVVKSGNKVTLVGIGNTKQYPRTSPSNPIVFTSVNHFTKWIKTEMKMAF